MPIRNRMLVTIIVLTIFARACSKLSRIFESGGTEFLVQITDSGQISGSFSKAAAEELAMSLNSGHLPAKLTVLNESPL